MSIESEPSNWRFRAACGGMDVNKFFPKRDDNPAEALNTCRRCPVREACLEEHLGEYRGIFGGLTGEQRAALRRGRKRVTVASACGTVGGYRLHLHRRETACEPCVAAKRERSREDRAKRGAAA